MSLHREVSDHCHCPIGFIYHILFILCIVMAGECGRKGAPRWWNMVQLLPQDEHNRSTSTAAELSIQCSKIPGLVPKQLRFCRNHKELMRSIAEGVRNGINECKYQFRGRRWNCSTAILHSSRAFKRKSIFGHVLDAASREAAFVHAITTAGVAHSITKACASGTLPFCGCDPERTPLPSSMAEVFRYRNWRWGGCNENIDYGIRMSREFVDAHLRVTKARNQISRHNNEAGRQLLKSNMWLKCKCHGLSGSCELETCWWSMPTLRRVGTLLKERYDEASEMRMETHKMAHGKVETIVAKHPSYTRPGSDDLVYVDKSPNFCDANRRRGILGTKGRRCSATSQGIEGCELLCCGRGYETKEVTRIDRCKCVFRWCCHVTCQECVTKHEIHTCK